MEDLAQLIINAVLYDLLGSKVLALSSFAKNPLRESFLKATIARYFELIEAGSINNCIPDSVEGIGVCLCRVNEISLLIGQSNGATINSEEFEQMGHLTTRLMEIVGDSSVRDAKSIFHDLASNILGKEVSICFISSPDPSSENKSGNAVMTLLNNVERENSTLSYPASIGPYRILVMRNDYSEVPSSEWSSELKATDIFVFVVAPPAPDSPTIENMISVIKQNTKSKIIVVPGSDEELELARSYETKFGMELSDSVSTKPSDLLLSILAVAGYTDMHPELARKKWTIDESIDKVISAYVSKEPIGHQAFFVVEKKSGKAVYTYYYETESKVLDTAPNVVAAISMFNIDKREPTKTSVFRTGDLVYAMIERENLIFTLITGDKEDVESVRSRFSFLPDLYFDEKPEQLSNPEDLYTSPPFTLKLLATLPPEQLQDKITPYPVEPLEWDRFQSEPVRDFLEAVWNSLDGNRTMSELAPGTGPEMVSGAIHLLRRMGAIDTKLIVGHDDIPIIVGKLDSEVTTLYSHLEDIMRAIDGQRTIREIGDLFGFEPSVLIAVFTELHRRGTVDLKRKKNTSP